MVALWQTLLSVYCVNWNRAPGPGKRLPGQAQGQPSDTARGSPNAGMVFVDLALTNALNLIVAIASAPTRTALIYPPARNFAHVLR